MRYGFGVDVGGTSIKLGLFSEAGDRMEKWEIPTRTEHGGAAVLPDVAAAVRRARPGTTCPGSRF